MSQQQQPKQEQLKGSLSTNNYGSNQGTDGDTESQTNELLATASIIKAESRMVAQDLSVTLCEPMDQDSEIDHLEVMIKRLERRTELLDKGVKLCQRNYGDDLSKYPDEVRQYLKNLDGPAGHAESRRGSTYKASWKHLLKQPKLPPYNYESLSSKVPEEAWPEKYHGKSAYDAQEFLGKCERVFIHVSHLFPTDDKKIAGAVSFLTNELEDGLDWLQSTSSNGGLNWKGFKQILYNQQEDPIIRDIAFWMGWDHVKQEPTQKVQNLVTRLRDLKSRIDAKSDGVIFENIQQFKSPLPDRQVIQLLFNKLTQEIKQKFIEGGHVPERMDLREFIATVTMLEETPDQDKSRCDEESKSSKRAYQEDGPSGSSQPTPKKHTGKRTRTG
jgi:hypothetical protein